MKRPLTFLLLVVVAWSTAIAMLAQDDFDAVFINEAQTFEVLYNDSWEIVEEDDISVTLLNENSRALVTFLDPTIFGLDLEGVDDALEASEVYRDLLPDAEAAKVVADSARDTVRGTIAGEDNFDAYVVIQFDDGSFGLALLAGSPIGLEQAEALVYTYNNVGSNAGTAKLNLGESKNYPNTLADHNKTWQEAIEELQDAGVIGSGGSLVFNENYAFFSGQGNWFTPLARNSPHKNVVMAGELTFEASESTELESCVLSSRITIEGRTATQSLNIGVTNSGNITLFDLFDDDEPANFDFRQLRADLDEPIHILYLALDDRATIYINGELFIEDTEIDERSGSFGISLTGRGPGARCEGRNIWVYQVPTFEEGVCEVSASSNVNKRSGPGTDFARAGQLAAGSVVQVVAQSDDGSFTWWKLEDETWVREDVVTEAGDCGNIPTDDI